MDTKQTKTAGDYFAMARAIMKERGCRWSEACLEIKRKYPEAAAAFGAPQIDPAKSR
ncbi:hypothetical protein OAS39_00665 [Pirellulales bacterium]|nr:hypothetical protein [Pirellulales bacterium]